MIDTIPPPYRGTAPGGAVLGRGIRGLGRGIRGLGRGIRGLGRGKACVRMPRTRETPRPKPRPARTPTEAAATLAQTKGVPVAGAASGGRGRPRPGASRRGTPARAGKSTTGKGRAGKSAAGTGTAPARPPALAPPPGPFRLGAIEGATPGRWIDTWHERMPHTPLDLVPLTSADQRSALTDGTVDAALVRLPFESAGMHLITLYDEIAVAVCATDSHLTAVDELTLADLADEIVITPRHPPLRVEVAGAVAPRFAPPETVADAIAAVAAGVGIVIVPMSLARLHHRKDTEYRPLADAPASTVALAWPQSSGETDPLVDTFIGIVRGRTANSSRA
ncbi:MAG: LysR substrate-binding domain-containing protein [Microbacterium sp.]